MHIHVRVHIDDQTVHTGQLFFDDSLTASVYRASAPYDTRPTVDTTDQTESIFQQAGASRATLTMTRQGSGYMGSMTMGVQA